MHACTNSYTNVILADKRMKLGIFKTRRRKESKYSISHQLKKENYGVLLPSSKLNTNYTPLESTFIIKLVTKQNPRNKSGNGLTGSQFL